MLFVCYPKCSTCKRAQAWLAAQGIEAEVRDIRENNPNEEELRRWHAMSGLPLKRFFNSSGQQYRALGLMDKLPGQERQEDKILDHMVLGNLLMSLEQTERQLIYLRYFANRTQTQVGEELGISQVQVSRMEKKILKQMREKI